jgi:hypothetical protein
MIQMLPTLEGAVGLAYNPNYTEGIGKKIMVS